MISIDLAFIIQFINFLLLMLILNFLLYKPVRKILADRDAGIASAYERTAAVDREVREKMELYELKLRQTKASAHEEKVLAINKAREEESAVIEKARLDASASISLIQNQVAGQAEEARIFLREQAEFISSEICEKVLGRSLER
jgi:F-type H+-transporting ATPase subunit b